MMRSPVGSEVQPWAVRECVISHLSSEAKPRERHELRLLARHVTAWQLRSRDCRLPSDLPCGICFRGRMIARN